jgi:hypothetical protein
MNRSIVKNMVSLRPQVLSAHRDILTVWPNIFRLHFNGFRFQHVPMSCTPRNAVALLTMATMSATISLRTGDVRSL